MFDLVVSLLSCVCKAGGTSGEGSGSGAGAAHLWESEEVCSDSGIGAGAAQRDDEDGVVVSWFRVSIDEDLSRSGIA